MKKIFVILISLFLLTGCTGERVKLGADQFRQIMDDNKYAIIENTNEVPYAEVSLIGYQTNIEIYFIVGKKKTDIEGIFVDQCENVYKRALEGYKDFASSGKNWSTLKVVDDNNYYYVSLVDNTYIYIKGPAQSQIRLDRLVEELE